MMKNVPAIQIIPEKALIDERVKITLSGFPPQHLVTIKARIMRGQNKIAESWATFKTDSRGEVDIEKNEPTSGTYDGLDGMGLFWSMHICQDMFENQPDPMPRLTVDPIDRNISQELMKFSGYWKGKWNDRYQSTLFVKLIDNTGRAEIYLSWERGESFLEGYIKETVSIDVDKDIITVCKEVFHDYDTWNRISFKFTTDGCISGEAVGKKHKMSVLMQKAGNQQTSNTKVIEQKQEQNPQLLLSENVVFDTFIDHVKVTSATFVRKLIPDNIDIVELDEDGLVGVLCKPKGNRKYPAIIMVSGSQGGYDKIGASLFASHGYAALSLAYFGIPPLPQSLSDIPLEYFEKALIWLEKQKNILNDKFAIMGGSRGGELALLLGSYYPKLCAVIATCPSSVLWSGFGKEHKHSWTYRGKVLDYMPEWTGDYDVPDDRQSPIETSPISCAILEDKETVEKASIPVEQIEGAVLLISGKEDAVWPSSQMAKMVMNRLKENNHPFPYKHIDYKGAGHGPIIPYLPASMITMRHPKSGILFSMGGNLKDRAFASSDFWKNTLNFLSDNLPKGNG